MSITRSVSIILLCAGVFGSFCALLLNILSYVRPTKLEGNISVLYSSVSNAAYLWGALLAAIAIAIIVVFRPLTSNQSARYKPFLILMGMSWFFAALPFTFLSSTHSLRFREGAWERGARFEPWHRIPESEARALMWLKIRGASAVALAE